MDDLYELWSSKDGSSTKVGSYSLMSDLLQAWLENQDKQPLMALASAGDDEVIVNDLMPVSNMITRLENATDWNQSIIDNAAYFTAVRFLGVGQYERHERLTEEVVTNVAQKLADESGGNYMIYAVNSRGNSTWVKNVTPTK